MLLCAGLLLSTALEIVPSLDGNMLPEQPTDVNMHGLKMSGCGVNLWCEQVQYVLTCLLCRVLLPFSCRLVEEGFNPAYGARPLRRAIMRLIEDCLAERILCGDIKEGDVVIMDVDPDGAIAVLAGDKKMRQVMDATPAGIS